MSCVFDSRMNWHAILLLGCLAACSASASGNAGLGSDAVPTQVIIQFTEKPAALNHPQALHAPSSNQRMASAASGSAAASTEQASFRAAAAGVAFQIDLVYKHVRFLPLYSILGIMRSIRRTTIQTGSVSWSISWSPTYGYLNRSMMASTRLCKTSLMASNLQLV